MILGIDVIGLIPALIPLLPDALRGFIPALFGGVGEWGGCVAQNGLLAAQCQGL
ncbi:hypothetical protein [Antrihabitans cavernicola]|uniref:hypothetical protein n=1 Tax=Antrihabitans cavernicola TaxID=2495913 RepID=UPI001659FECC|nr:hypothetical protein [Spelaeibacter cavernicola]